MAFDWDAFLARLDRYPSDCHRLLAPCPDDRIQAVEKELGVLPETLERMLKRFNGAELFIYGVPLVTIFGISTIPPIPPLEWAKGWYVDEFTAQWRSAGSGRQDDWAIGMMSYGGVVLLDGNERIKEWDLGERKWLTSNCLLEQWIEKIMSDGDAISAE